MSETVKVCPNCGDATFRYVAHKDGTANSTKQYRCTMCKHRFDNPKEKASEEPANLADTVSSSLGQKLLEIDPEDI